MIPYTVVILTVLLQVWAAHCSDIVLNGPHDLSDQYFSIFKTGNRNAASHLWVSFVLERASSMSADTLHNVLKGFCPVSGSVLPDDPRTMYKVTLPRVNGGKVTGVARHCCWPCICDLSDLARVDTKTVPTRDGPQILNMLVIGDPCTNPAKLDESFTDPFEGKSTTLRESAPELACNASNRLHGAMYSDHGYPIIGPFFTDGNDIDGVVSPPKKISADDPTFGFGEMCVMRRKSGYNSGMGLIFHLVASIAPIENSPPLPLPDVSTDLANSLASKVAMPHKFALPPGPQLQGSAGQSTKWTSAAVLSVLGLAIATAFRKRSRSASPPPVQEIYVAPE